MEKETRPFIPWQLADDFMTAVFEKVGVPEADARLCSDVLLESDRRGIESHGCNRFKPIYIDRIKAGILNPVTKIDNNCSSRCQRWYGNGSQQESYGYVYREST